MAARIFYLEEFGLDLRRLARLGRTPLDVQIDLKVDEPARPLAGLPPEERLRRLSARRRRVLERLLKKLEVERHELIGKPSFPFGIRCRLPAMELRRIAALADVRRLWLRRVPGRRRRRERKDPHWFAVRGRVAIQQENRIRGLQTMEERIVIVEARSEPEAVRRLQGLWREYEEPYLNDRGEMVRWKLEAIEDVYELMDRGIDPRGTEVYSRLYDRRTRPEAVWRIAYRRRSSASSRKGRRGPGRGS